MNYKIVLITLVGCLALVDISEAGQQSSNTTTPLIQSRRSKIRFFRRPAGVRKQVISANSTVRIHKLSEIGISPRNKRLNYKTPRVISTTTTTTTTRKPMISTNQTVQFLTNLGHYLSLIEKEMNQLSNMYPQMIHKYGKRLNKVIKFELRPAYNEMKGRLCDEFLNNDDQDDTPTPIYQNKPNRVRSHGYSHIDDEHENNLIVAMYKREQRRRSARYSKKRSYVMTNKKKRLVRDLCSKYD